MTITVHHGDSREVLKAVASASVAACVTDPPYALVSIGKRFGKAGAAEAKSNGASGVYRRASAGFMGQTWDTGETAFDPAFWREVLRVMKPGGHLVAFGGTRSYHRLVCAIEDAGFEIRDQIAWLYGSGFPKSHDVAKGIDKSLGAVRPVIGTETLSNDIRGGGLLDVAHGEDRPPLVRDVTEAGSAQAKGWEGWEGWGTALKPALEPIVLARKPLDGTVAGNVMKYSTGGLNIGACRVGDEGGHAYAGPREGASAASVHVLGHGHGHGLNGKKPQAVKHLGRWPANVCHDGSTDVLEAFPGGSARFFYDAKADADDRLGSKHPTVKPVDLMAWLVRLVTPPGGLVLDPFAGSGSTGMACLREGFDAVLIEREAQFVADIRRRIAHVAGDDLPLFGGNDTASSDGGGGAGRSTAPSPGTGPHHRTDGAEVVTP